MKFSVWLSERNQRDDMKMPKRLTNLELHQRVSSQIAHQMKHGRAGPMDSDNRTEDRKGHRGKRDREAIRRSERGE